MWLDLPTARVFGWISVL
ncbi:hypothetical protein E2C01_050794 [Portunus trituberculatus]|uniref:Uncharacterized protein n=1 Tax=Portunus trituberculatus TaxID=210409 RepID=A0A5B7GIH1_PORTR|nr:hypothetical protein [Portunus trituberculatus]